MEPYVTSQVSTKKPGNLQFFEKADITSVSTGQLVNATPLFRSWQHGF